METQNLQVEESVLIKKSTPGRIVMPAFKISDKAIVPAWRGHESGHTDQWSGIKSTARHLMASHKAAQTRVGEKTSSLTSGAGETACAETEKLALFQPVHKAAQNGSETLM